MIAILVLIFIIAFLILFLGKHIEAKFYKWFSLLPFSLFVCTSIYVFYVHWEHRLLFEQRWIPNLNINLDFSIDGLSLLFSLLITGIGTLVYLYASEYLDGHKYLNRFYCYLTLFMGAMLGLVLSDNLITLFIFWELTSLSSFFLIGFNNEEEASQKSAMTALTITGLGGFLLLAGFMMLYNISGTFTISEMLNSPDIFRNSSGFSALFFLILGGAFTKSAQFPFHFWLPGAMKAPTPVSAYLHSATMVKAGIYLLMRFQPILNDGFLWHNTLMFAGGITMFYGAFHSILRTDLKAILAYSTIAALGMIVFLLGLGSPSSLLAALTFTLAHALYKAALFMGVGAIDHTVHTRELSKLSGLKQLMPLLFVGSIIAAFSSAGFPLTLGFISKDLIYESILEHSPWTWILLIIGMLTNILLAGSGFLVGLKPYIGVLPERWRTPSLHLPGFRLWGPVVLLSTFTLLFGTLPWLAGEGFLYEALRAISPTAKAPELKLWHGFGLVLFLSFLTILGGLIVFFISRKRLHTSAFVKFFDRISPKSISEDLGAFTRRIAFHYTRFFQNGYLRNYLLMIIIFITVLVGYRLFTTVPLKVNTQHLSDFRIYELVVFVMTVIAIYFTIRTRSRLTAIASLGILGYCISLIFVFYGAPDLAMTQFTIDTLTVVLFVLVLFKLPPFLSYKNKATIVRDIIVSVSFGALITIITLQALVSPASKETSHFFAENAYTLAKGKNVVNVILVDFRGFDTMIETIVLSIAALGVYSLLKYPNNNEEAN